MHRIKQIFSPVLILSLVFVCTAYGDVYMKQKTHTDGFTMMGQNQPATDEIQNIWMGNNRLANHSEKQSIIVLVDKGIQYFVNHEKRTYVQAPLNVGEAILSEMDKQADDAEQAEAMKNMMQGMAQMTVTITPTADTKKIGLWNCKKYNQELTTFMGPMRSEVWASEDIKLDMNLYSKLTQAMFSMMPGMAENQQKMMAEFKKIKGVVVLNSSANTIMGQTIKSFQELLEVKEM